MKSKIIIIALLLRLTVSVSNAASTIYVDAGSPNDPGSGTSGDPFRRIQPAINAAVNGDTVLIKQRIYSGPGNYNLDPGGRLITIRSEDPNNATVVANTVIDPQHADRGFNIHSNENENCVISGLTITNGNASSEENDVYDGGGIYCMGNRPVISNCVIKNGYADGFGGGICCDYADATVINCTLQNNISNSDGGGISCESSSVTITGCTITGNTAAYEGGGIDSGDSNSTIFNCLILDNNSLMGGGINCFGSNNSSLINCTLVANTATYSGGAILCQSSMGRCNTVAKNSILWANSADIGKQIYIDVNGYTLAEYSDGAGRPGGRL